jgi:RimJ/RimL family protein N-acetyltransferase
MIPPSGISTARLLLRLFRPEDAADLERLAGAREIADTTISIPHPYEPWFATAWIGRHREEFARGKAARFAVCLEPGGELIGAVELRDIDREHLQAELSFWVGRAWWGRGYATEAATAVLAYAFDALALNRIYAHHMVRNPASGAVLRKIGMRREGILRQRVRKWGVFEDVALWAILRADRP